MSEDARLAHHFEDAEQQREASTLGMWAFLITEIMFFGGLFAGYGVYRSQYPGGFDLASRRLDVVWGAINTGVLICSSLTMALAVDAVQRGSRRPLCFFLIATMILGTAFLGIKGIEYSHKWEEGLVPGRHFHWSPERAHQPGARLEPSQGAAAQSAPHGVELFFGFYFVMTGMHALHMVIGLAIMAVLLFQSWKGRYSPQYYAPIDVAGLYWHFVDIVWIYLFPMLYLISRS